MSLLKRILIDSAILIGVLFLPWYIPVLIMAYAYWKHDMFEILIFALLMDILYKSYELSGYEGFGVLTFLFATAIGMIILNLAKKRIRFYS